MLNQERKDQLLWHINNKDFSKAVSCIDEFLQESSDEGTKAQRIEEIKIFISGEGFIQALKRVDAFPDIQNGSTDIKEYIDISDDYGMTIFDHAAENGLLDVVGLLCAIGADVNHISDNGFTPIFLAIIGAKDENESDILDIVQLLCNSGADVNYVNKEKNSEYIGFTPMRTAIEKRSLDIVKVLCENGADIFVFANDIMVKTLRKDGKEMFYFKDNLKEKGCSPKKGGVSPPKNPSCGLMQNNLLKILYFSTLLLIV